MKTKTLVAIVLLIVLGGCSHREYNMVEGTVKVTDVLTKTEIPYLYYSDPEIHIEIENFKKSPVDFQFQAYQLGLSVGRREGEGE